MFKFEEYPEIMDAHKKSNKLENITYKESSRCERNGLDCLNDEKWQKAMEESKNFNHNIYAEIIYKIFKEKKPIMIWKKTGEKTNWDKIFEKKDFSDLSDRQKKILYMMIEEERPYILPPEYYDDRDWFEEVKKKS